MKKIVLKTILASCFILPHAKGSEVVFRVPFPMLTQEFFKNCQPLIIMKNSDELIRQSSNAASLFKKVSVVVAAIGGTSVALNFWKAAKIKKLNKDNALLKSYIEELTANIKNVSQEIQQKEEFLARLEREKEEKESFFQIYTETLFPKLKDGFEEETRKRQRLEFRVRELDQERALLDSRLLASRESLTEALVRIELLRAENLTVSIQKDVLESELSALQRVSKQQLEELSLLQAKELTLRSQMESLQEYYNIGENE